MSSSSHNWLAASARWLASLLGLGRTAPAWQDATSAVPAAVTVAATVVSAPAAALPDVAAPPAPDTALLAGPAPAQAKRLLARRLLAVARLNPPKVDRIQRAAGRTSARNQPRPSLVAEVPCKRRSGAPVAIYRTQKPAAWPANVVALRPSRSGGTSRTVVRRAA